MFNEMPSEDCIRRFDQQLKSVKIPNMLFERVTQEFEDSISQLHMVGGNTALGNKQQ